MLQELKFNYFEQILTINVRMRKTEVLNFKWPNSCSDQKIEDLNLTGTEYTSHNQTEDIITSFTCLVFNYIPLLANCDTRSLPRRESISSAAGHSGVLTVTRRSCRKFSNKGRKSVSSLLLPHFLRNTERN